MDIVWLGQPGCHDVRQAGGKAANLSRLADKYPVPRGFCLTASSYNKNSDDFTLSDKIRKKAAAAYDKLAALCSKTAPPVAVRSSAIDEDGHTASFAGQYATFLNVAGTDSVIKAIEKCRASAVSNQVQAYRREYDRSSCHTGIAVLVQQLTMADASAVVFSINPINKNRNQILINANWGLGESIVGGTVTPDIYILEKSDLNIEEKRIAQKTKMTVRMPEGGTKEVVVPRLLMNRAALTDAQIDEIGRVAVELEHEMGWPADIECAWEADRLYLLQCRPVTSGYRY